MCSDVLEKMDALSAAKFSQQMHKTVADIVARRSELFPEEYVSGAAGAGGVVAASGTSEAKTPVSPRSDDHSLSMTVVGTIPVAASPPFNVLIIQCKSEVRGRLIFVVPINVWAQKERCVCSSSALSAVSRPDGALGGALSGDAA